MFDTFDLTRLFIIICILSGVIFTLVYLVELVSCIFIVKKEQKEINNESNEINNLSQELTTKKNQLSSDPGERLGQYKLKKEIKKVQSVLETKSEEHEIHKVKTENIVIKNTFITLIFLTIFLWGLKLYDVFNANISVWNEHILLYGFVFFVWEIVKVGYQLTFTQYR